MKVLVGSVMGFVAMLPAVAQQTVYVSYGAPAENGNAKDGAWLVVYMEVAGQSIHR